MQEFNKYAEKNAILDPALGAVLPKLLGAKFAPEQVYVLKKELLNFSEMAPGLCDLDSMIK